MLRVRAEDSFFKAPMMAPQAAAVWVSVLAGRARALRPCRALREGRDTWMPWRLEPAREEGP